MHRIVITLRQIELYEIMGAFAKDFTFIGRAISVLYSASYAVQFIVELLMRQDYMMSV